MSEPTRRDFSRELGGLAALAGLGLLAGGAEGQNPAPNSQADLLLQMTKLRFPNITMTDDEWAQVRQRLAGGMASGQFLHRMPVTNADEPDFTFDADVL